ncbi:hypothetical protein ACX0HA_14260 [Flavobacterium hauense]
MKKVYLLSALGALMFSCSSDDNGDSGNNSTGDFLPVNSGNYWVYDVQGTSVSGRDSLYVSGDTVINNNTYKKLKAKDGIATGFFSNALNNNGIRHADGKTYLSGTAGLAISDELPFDLAITDFIVFDQNASENQQLSIKEGTINQDLEGYGLTINYKLSSKAKAPVASITVNGEQYSNVKTTEITLNMEINVSVTIPGIPIPISFPLMAKQDVAVSTQYYAEGIGAVKSVTDITYQLAELPDVELPIPQSGSEHQEEVLVHYNVE